MLHCVSRQFYHFILSILKTNHAVLIILVLQYTLTSSITIISPQLCLQFQNLSYPLIYPYEIQGHFIILKISTGTFIEIVNKFKNKFSS